MSIEPGVFLVFFGLGLFFIISQNLIIKKMCVLNMGYSPDICSRLDTFKEVEEMVQKRVDVVTMTTLLLAFIPGLLLCLFSGPWSDRHGRKTLLLFPLWGLLGSQVVLITLVLVENARAELYILLGPLSCGMCSFIAGVFSHISDVSGTCQRTSRMALVDLSVFMGYPLGNLVSGVLFKRVHYIGIFSASAVIFGLVIVHFTFFLKETRGLRAHESLREPDSGNSDPQTFRFLHWRSVTDVLRLTLRARPGAQRKIFNILILVLLIQIGLLTINFIYLYVELRLDWHEEEFSVWSMFSALSKTLGSVGFVALLSGRLRISDSIIGIVGSLSGVVDTVIFAFIYAPWMIYMSSLVGALSTCPGLVARAMLSKMTLPDEQGQLFALVSCLQAIVPCLAIPLSTWLYNATMNYFPGAIFLCHSALFAISTAIYCYIHCHGASDYEPILDDSTDAAREAPEQDN